MKSSELHRLIQKNGWQVIRQAGSHVIYEKGSKTISVPFHGAKEMGTGIANKFIREMGLK
ncbi:type II toxin-antitoxin system HicA family toxin [uncultured Alistipes sp.]|uniref:type II toxin-antitoxin system HicA family toxin n=1 Tax=uncultured Alistipes sp. TaxID=538949 RepID=UPI0026238265|nr:type II toxin-antitoxin system HicA family toxin [uncultured Alistipes sp.]